MDDWSELFDFSKWQKAVETEGKTFPELTQPVSIDSKLPWDCIDSGVSSEFLKLEYSRYLNGESLQDCKIEGCHNCSNSFDCSSQIEHFKKDWQKPDVVRENAIEKKMESIEKKINCENAVEIKEYAVYRLNFIKTFRIKFISHLDLQKIFLSGLKQIGVKFDYTLGFHKKPKIEFAAPLSLGFIGVNELLDITIQKQNIDELKIKINNYFKKNIIIKKIEVINKKNKSLSFSVSSADYRIVLHKNSGIDNKKIDSLLSGKIEITKKDSIKTVDLRQNIEQYSLKSGCLYDVVFMRIKVSQNGAVNPYSIIQKIVSDDYIKDISRTGLNVSNYSAV